MKKGIEIDYVSETRAWMFVGLIFGVGALLGFVLGRRKSRKR